MPVETFEEFKSELETLRSEIQEKKDALDVALVGSWVDRVVILLDKMSQTLSLLEERVDVLSDRTGYAAEKK